MQGGAASAAGVRPWRPEGPAAIPVNPDGGQAAEPMHELGTEAPPPETAEPAKEEAEESEEEEEDDYWVCVK